MAVVVDQPQVGAANPTDPLISRVPYLPGLDGLRAIAVVAVMVYHANSDWLPGGYLGVEMFFVISGYLITLLIIAEHERDYRVSLRKFWERRARRLLPALTVLLIGVTMWTALFERGAVGQLRGDVIAGVFYVSNWYQLWVGLGYTAAGDFAPLRHLWSLAVEEQFYVVWPLVMVLLLRLHGTRRIASTSRWFVVAALAITAITALLYHPGAIGAPNETPEAYWSVLGHDISKLDFLYLGSFSRAAGILLGAAMATMWRPYALRRSPAAGAGWAFDVAAALALLGFAWLVWNVPLISDDGAANGTLFRGGLLVAATLTLVMIAGVTHPSAHVDRVLNRSLLLWIGTRSYGLYLFHWPTYQAIRGIAGNKLTMTEFALAMVITAVIAEASYRLVEMPIRERRFRSTWAEWLRRVPKVRVWMPAAGALAVIAVGASGWVLVTAEIQENEIAESLSATDDDVVNLLSLAEEASGDAEAPGGALSDRLAAPTTAKPLTTGPPPLNVPTVTAVAALPPTTVSDQTPITSPPATVAPTTAALVPATTMPPATDAQAPAAEIGPRSRGVVADLNGVAPLGIDPLPSDTALSVIALGDSVMKGAAEELSAKGVFVDAVVSRQFTAFLPDVQAVRDAGLLGSVVIVHLGTNGGFPQASADQMMAILADVPVVVFITGKADRGWITGNNAIIRALPERYPNVTVLDWETIGSNCDDCFYGDQIHLDPSGQRFYADLLGRLIGF